MRVDQWVYFYPGRKPNSKVNFKCKNTDELFIWCNHYKLDYYMYNLYKKKDGVYEFNSQKVWLSKEDILNLQKEIISNNFFDDDLELNENQEQKEKDLKFCDLALEKIEKHYQLYYTNLW